MAIHTLDNVACTLEGILRCDGSGVPVCASSYESSEYYSSEEVSSEYFSSFEESSAYYSSFAGEVSSLADSSEEFGSSAEEVSSEIAFSSAEAESSAYTSELPSGSEGPGPEESSFAENSGVRGLPCVELGTECPTVGCTGCCGVQIREIGTTGCPTAPFTKREIILHYYTEQEIEDMCDGNGPYCDFAPLAATACDEISGIAILYFDVCCGCEGSSAGG